MSTDSQDNSRRHISAPVAIVVIALLMEIVAAITALSVRHVPAVQLIQSITEILPIITAVVVLSSQNRKTDAKVQQTVKSTANIEEHVNGKMDTRFDALRLELRQQGSITFGLVNDLYKRIDAVDRHVRDLIPKG